MNKVLIFSLVCLGLWTRATAQSDPSGDISPRMKIGAGYFGQNITRPGLIFEVEYEQLYTPLFSLPARANLGYHYHPDYNTLFLDIHKGFRKYFQSGLFVEQGLSAGLILKSYQTDRYYLDEYFISVSHGNRPVGGFMPGISVGTGYDLSREKNGSSLLWIRPKIYWDLGFRNLHLPYFGLQLGYSHTFKTQKS